MKSCISLGTHMQIVKDGLHIFSAYLFVRHAVQLFHPLKPQELLVPNFSLQ